MLSDGARTAVGTVTALAAAAAFGACSVLQYRATHLVPMQPVGRPTLLVDLLRRPAWRLSLLLAALGFTLQVLALDMLPLVLVQPLLVTGLLWYVLLSAAAERRRPDRVMVAGSAMCLASLSAFLLLASPATGPAQEPASAWRTVWLGVALVTSVGVCVALASVLNRQWRPLPLALATGLCYGVTAGLVRSLAPHFHEGLPAVLGQWQTYAIIVIGPAGVLLNQNSYQAGPQGAPALATIVVTDPLVAIAVGYLWLGEEIRTGPWYGLGEILSLLALSGAVLILAHRAPHVRAGRNAVRPIPPEPHPPPRRWRG